jgi:hypothetical protein
MQYILMVEALMVRLCTSRELAFLQTIPWHMRLCQRSYG